VSLYRKNGVEREKHPVYIYIYIYISSLTGVYESLLLCVCSRAALAAVMSVSGK